MLGFLFTRTKELYLKECELVSAQLKNLPAECQLEELSIVRSQVDLPLTQYAAQTPDYVTSLRRLELNNSQIRFSKAKNLNNLQHLVLKGQSAWENLSNFGTGLTGLRTLKIVFDSDIQKNFDQTVGLSKLMPKNHKLEQLIVVYRFNEFISVLSKVMEHQLNLVSQ